MSTGAGSSANTKMTLPRDQSPPEQAVAPVASLSSEIDPLPHYTASAACAGGAGYAYAKLNNPRAAAVAAGFSLLYFTAGRLVTTGSERMGYDIGTLTSLGLLATSSPAARGQLGNLAGGYVGSMGTIGGLSAVANAIKSYQYRTGKPHEVQTKRA